MNVSSAAGIRQYQWSASFQQTTTRVRLGEGAADQPSATSDSAATAAAASSSTSEAPTTPQITAPQGDSDASSAKEQTPSERSAGRMQAGPPPGMLIIGLTPGNAPAAPAGGSGTARSAEDLLQSILSAIKGALDEQGIELPEELANLLDSLSGEKESESGGDLMQQLADFLAAHGGAGKGSANGASAAPPVEQPSNEAPAEGAQQSGFRAGVRVYASQMSVKASFQQTQIGQQFA